MKPEKKLYRYLIILAMIAFMMMLINLWINKNTTGIEPKVDTPEQQNIRLFPVSMEQPLQSRASSVARPAITITKRPPKEKRAVALEEEIKEKQEITKKPTNTAKSSLPDPSSKGTTDDELSSGITETSKRPTAIQIQEMKDQGIVIW